MDPFNFSQMQQMMDTPEGRDAMQNNPMMQMFQKLAQDCMSDPDFLEMAKEIQTNMAGSNGQADYQKYMETMSKMYTNEKYMKKAEEIGQLIMQTNPQISQALESVMSQMSDPTNKGKIEGAIGKLKEDPEFRPFVQKMEQDKPMEAMQWLQERPKLIEKYKEVLKQAFELPALDAFGLGMPAAVTGAPAAPAVEEEEGDLHTAASEGNPSLLKRLLEGGAAVDEVDDEGRTALHFAVGYGEMDCAKILLDCGASTNSVDQNKNTPLHYAAGYGQVESTKLLVRKGAALDAKNGDGNTAVEVARMNEHKAVVELLEKAAFTPKGLGGLTLKGA